MLPLAQEEFEDFEYDRLSIRPIISHVILKNQPPEVLLVVTRCIRELNPTHVRNVPSGVMVCTSESSEQGSDLGDNGIRYIIKPQHLETLGASVLFLFQPPL